jgi:hypothetical protein
MTGPGSSAIPTAAEAATPHDLEPARATARAKPTVSIVITNYNYADYCGQAIESALAQTYAPVEVIVVDDGSTDGSRSVIAPFEEASRIKAVWRPNGGQAAAMNSGFAASRGEIVMFLDADDVLEPRAAERVVASWSPDLSRVQFPLALIDRAGRPRGLHPFSHHLEAGDLHWKLVVGSSFWFAPTSGNAFARTALAPIFPIPEETWRLCADVYAVGLSAAYGPVRTLPEPLARYRVHGRNNWYQEEMDPAHRERVRHQRMQLWLAVAEQIRADDAAAPLLAAESDVRDRAILALARRIITTHHLSPGGAPRQVLRRARRAAWRALARAQLPLRRKLDWAAFLAVAARGTTGRDRIGRWLAHPSLQPDWLRRRLGAPDDGWAAARPRPAEIETFPVERPIHFGAGQEGRRFQWFGWDDSQPGQSWGVGTRAALIGRLPAEVRRARLALMLAAAQAGPVETQRLIVLVNGRIAFDDRVGAEQRVALAADIPAASGELAIEFRYPESVVGHFLDPASVDLRALGVALSALEIEVEREDDAEAAWPFVPAGPRLTGAALVPLLAEGWHAPSGDIVRMARRNATLHLTLLGGTGFDHAVTLQLEPTAAEGRVEPVRIAALGRDGAEVSLGGFDLARENETVVLLPRGIVGSDGRLTLSLRADALVPSDETATADIPVAEGPGLAALAVERLDLPERLPVYPIGSALRFGAGGEARPYLGEGWRASETRGTLTSEVRATIRGLCLRRDREIFLTAVVFPPASDGGFLDQTLTVTANGRLVAAYDIDQRSEITAILPRDILGEDRVLTIELEVSILAAPAHLGAGTDNRVLGIGVEVLMLEYA